MITQTTNQNQTGHNPTMTPAPAQSATPETKPAPVIEMTEAPYSWNVSAQDENGFVEIFTVRAVSEKGFFERVQRVKQTLAAQNYKPAPTRGAPIRSAAPANDSSADTETAPTCGIHGTPMQKRIGKGGAAFWSCPQKFANGNYCNYRAPKE